MQGFGRFISTQLVRETATQELQRIIEPLGDGGTHIRVVQVVVPLGEVLYGVIDAQDDEGQPDHLSDKSFNYPPLAPGATIKFPLGPQQTLSIASKQGIITIAVTIETYEPS